MDNGTSITIDLAGRYAAAFGIVKASEMMAAVSLTKEDNKYQVDFFDDYNPATEDIRLRYDGEELKFFSMLTGDQASVFAPPVIIDFRREKDLVETETNGDDSVIVERWGTRPWEISMQGILIDVENRQYPTDQVRKLHRIFKYNNVVEVVGVLFEEKDIDTIYFRDIQITPMEGYSDTVQFSLTASSIKEVNWSLLKPNQ